MSLRFVLAPAGAGKTHHCLSSIAAELERDPLGPPLLFIVPEQATFIHERMLALLAPGGGFSRADVTGFDRLMRRLPKRGPALPQLSEAGRLLLAAGAIQRCREQLQLFAAQAGNSGFAAFLCAAAEELQAYCLEPAELRQAAERLGSQRLREIALLYAAYREQVDGRFASHAQGLLDLATAIRAGWLQEARIYVDGYSEFTPAERQVLAALTTHCAGVEIMMPLDPEQAEQARQEEAVFYPSWHEYAQLTELAERERAEILPPLLLKGEQGRFCANAELAAVEALLAGREKPLLTAAPQALRLIQAAGRRAELEWVGREIIRLTREQGCRYRDISILVRDSAPYEYLLPAVFGPLNIPYFIDSKKPLLYHPLIELIRAALEVWAFRPHYRHIFRFLKNILNPIMGDQADALDNYALAHGLRFWDWPKESWDFPPLDGEEESTAAQMYAIRSAGAGPLLELCARLGQEASAAQLKAELLRLLDELDIWQRLAALEQQALLDGEAEQAAQHRQAGDKLRALLDEAELLLGETRYPARQLFQLLEAALSGLTLSTIPPGRDQVFVASLERSRNPEIKAAFVLSLNEGLLPRKVSSDGLFSDEDRRALSAQGLPLAPDSASRQFRENYLAYIALTRSSQRLYLSYILRDEEGAQLAPSPLLRRLSRSFPALRAESAAQFSINQLSGMLPDLTLAAQALHQPDPPALWREVRRCFEQEAAFAPLLARLDQGLSYQPRRRPLDRANLQRLYGKKLRGSVSRLERFARCPFSYFAGYGLSLTPRREFRLRPADRGQLFHDVLAELGQELQRQGQDWADLQPAQAERLVDASLSRHLPRFLSGLLTSSARYAYLQGRIRDTLISTALLLAESLRRGDFRPIAFELPFGSGPDSWPAFRIPLDDGKVLELSGRIDRIDMARSADGQRVFFRVIDYKSGDISLKPRDLQAGLRLQLLIYLQVTLANCRLLAPQGQALAAGAFYAPVHDEIVNLPGPPAADPAAELRMGGLAVLDRESVRLQDRDIQGASAVIPAALGKDGFYANSPGLDRAALDELNAQLLELIRANAQAMLDGQIQVSPLRDKDNDSCAFCDYQSVCAFDRELNPARKIDEQL